MIAMLFGWTKLPQWAMELILIGLLGLGFAIYHRAVIEKGIAEQVAIDNAATIKLQNDTKVQTAALKAQADTAEHAHDNELSELAAYRSAHPQQPVRLCLDAAHDRGTILPGSTGIDISHEGLGAAGISIQHVPDGDSGIRTGGAGPDIASMLGALAGSADQVSAELREYQARNPK